METSDNRTTHPKVFISYAWGKNKARVKEIADRLIGEGVEVVIDVYDLKPGMNKHFFMQKLVDDPSVEKVLMFCDAEYVRKANDFKGGVGEESTIISSEVYGRVGQTKFIPVVLERDQDGQACLPTMCKALIYNDFSTPELEAEEFGRLVRNLWGVPDARKPILAPRPRWLDAPAANTAALRAQLSIQETAVKKVPNPNGVLVRTTQEFIAALNSLVVPGSGDGDLMEFISQTEEIRNCFVLFVENGLLQEGVDGEKIGTIIEKMYNGIDLSPVMNNPALEESCLFFFWDVFICTTALLIEYERFGDLHRFLNRTYYLRNLIGTSNDPTPYSFSQFRHALRLLEGPYKQKINPRLISLAADVLTKRTFGSVITKRNLVVADVVLAHLAMLYGQSQTGFTWYPALAPYSDYAGYDLPWARLGSRSFCAKLFPLFGVADMDAFRQIVREMSDKWKADQKSSYYSGGWGIPRVLSQKEYEEIGTLP